MRLSRVHQFQEETHETGPIKGSRGALGVEDRFLAASSAEQELLLRMANRAGDRLTAADLRSALRDVPNINELLRRLVGRGLLYRPTRGSYRFALPLFGRYLRRHRKITKITETVIFDDEDTATTQRRDRRRPPGPRSATRQSIGWPGIRSYDARGAAAARANGSGDPALAIRLASADTAGTSGFSAEVHRGGRPPASTVRRREASARRTGQAGALPTLGVGFVSRAQEAAPRAVVSETIDDRPAPAGDGHRARARRLRRHRTGAASPASANRPGASGRPLPHSHSSTRGRTCVAAGEDASRRCQPSRRVGAASA
jgi:hypothetical protein